MAEEKNQGHIDIALLLRQAKDSLSFSREDLVSLSDEDLQSLLFGKEIQSQGEVLSYASLFSLLDVQEDTLYPFFFLPTKFSGSSFGLIKAVPIFNCLGEELLNALGLSLPKASAFEVKKMIVDLNNEIEKKKAANRVVVVPSLFFLDKQAMLLNRLYPDLLKMNADDEDKPQFNSIFYHEGEKDITELFKDLEGDSLFLRQQRAMKRLDAFHGAKVSYLEPEIRNHFLLNFLHNYTQQNKSVLLVAKDERYENLKAYLKQRSLHDFMFEYRRLTPSDFQSERIEYHFNEPLKNGEEIYQQFIASEEKYDQLAKERRLAYSYPEKLLQDVFSSQDILSADIYDLSLDTRDYHEEDYLRDEGFLKLLPKKKTIAQSYIRNHLFYGLSCSSKRENYDAIELLIITLSGEIRNFANGVRENPILKDAKWEVSTLKEFRELEQNIRILRGYNGFPIKYFRFDFTEESLAKLNNLKSLYQAVSSSRLMVSNLCHENVYVSDLSKMVKLYQGNMFTRQKAKRMIGSYLRTKKNVDYRTLFRILDAYLKAQQSLKEALPECVDQFGSIVMTMNGVAEIESNIRYIHSFRQRTKEMPGFGVENPFVRRWMNDSRFRLEMDDFFQTREKEAKEFENHLKEFISYFSEGTRSYDDVCFVEMLRYFGRINLATYDEFEEYTSMREAFSASSLVLQLAVRKYENMERSLSDFPQVFRMSLMRGCFQRGKRLFRDREDAFSEALCQYYSYLIEGKELSICRSYNTLAHDIVSYCNQSEHLAAYQETRTAFLSGQWDSSLKRAAYQIYAKRYPITLIRSGDLGLLEDETYDEVLVLDSRRLSDAELLSAYRVGTSVMILDASDEADMRTQNYHNTLINRAIIYGRLFEKTWLTGRMAEIVQETARSMDYEFRDDLPFFPYTIVSHRFPGHYYAVLPDIMMPKNINEKELRELRMFLIQENVLFVPFATLYFFADFKTEMTALYQLIVEAIDKSEKRQKMQQKRLESNNSA